MERTAIIFFLVLSFFSLPLRCATWHEQEIYRISLQEKAKNLSLSQDPYFKKLLYYEKALFGKTKSICLNEEFFASKWGKINPEIELKTLINGLFDPQEDLSPQCKFPQRYKWLKEKLEVNEGLIETPQCPQYDEWAQAIKPKKIILVFAAGYLKNPSTLYGHTFLLLKKEDSKDSKLLDYTINYAAQTNDEKGALFAFKGLSGLYGGTFTTMPYYMKIQEYVHMENRDLWEYELDLSEEEIDNLLRHSWELGKAAFPYYFFNRNCSWQLIPLLEIAKNINIKKNPYLWIIPSDTAKIIAGKIAKENPVQRPSLYSLTFWKFENLNPEEKKAFFSLLDASDKEPDIKLKEESMAKVYEAVFDYLELSFQKKNLTQKEFDLKIDPLLIKRAEMGKTYISNETYPMQTPPTSGHESLKIVLGMAADKHDAYYQLTFRPAFSDLLDDDDGYLKNSALEMGRTSLRYAKKSNKFFLKELNLVNVISLNPFNELEKPLSWSISLGYKEYEKNKLQKSNGIFSIEGGPGISLSKNNFLFYALNFTDISYGGILEKNIDISFGAKSGFKTKYKNISLLAEAKYAPSLISGAPLTAFESELSYMFNKNLYIRTSFRNFWKKQEAGIYIHKFFKGI